MNAPLRPSAVRASSCLGGQTIDRPFYSPAPSAYVLVAIGVVILLFLCAGEMSYQDEVRAAQFYCDQVELFLATDGRQGHPDYKRIWAAHCPAAVTGNQP